jgi:hypothetical protein
MQVNTSVTVETIKIETEQSNSKDLLSSLTFILGTIDRSARVSAVKEKKDEVCRLFVH